MRQWLKSAAPGFLRGVAAFTWRLRLQPSPEGWVDMAFAVPIMDTTRAREELGWEPRKTSEDAFRELLEGMQDGARPATTPALAGARP